MTHPKGRTNCKPLPKVQFVRKHNFFVRYVLRSLMMHSNSECFFCTCFKRHCQLQGGPTGNAQSSWLLASLSQLKLNCFTLPRKSSVVPARARPVLRLRPAHAQDSAGCPSNTHAPEHVKVYRGNLNVILQCFEIVMFVSYVWC